MRPAAAATRHSSTELPGKVEIELSGTGENKPPGTVGIELDKKQNSAYTM